MNYCFFYWQASVHEKFWQGLYSSAFKAQIHRLVIMFVYLDDLLWSVILYYRGRTENTFKCHFECWCVFMLQIKASLHYSHLLWSMQKFAHIYLFHILLLFFILFKCVCDFSAVRSVSGLNLSKGFNLVKMSIQCTPTNVCGDISSSGYFSRAVFAILRFQTYHLIYWSSYTILYSMEVCDFGCRDSVWWCRNETSSFIKQKSQTHWNLWGFLQNWIISFITLYNK